MDKTKQDQKSPVIFDKERASSYDDRFAKLAPMRDALHLLMHLVLSELPANAHILCVGVGTGAELLDLARAFPQWQFTAVEPAAPMLSICRRRVEEAGIASRCNFHQGYLDSLPESAPFHAATSILVSHFLTKTRERQSFFCQIAERLTPGGYLINADLASDMSAATYESLFQIWVRSWKYCDMPAEEIEKLSASIGQDVALLPLQEIESMIKVSGFDTPVLFFQTLLIHAWYSRLPF